MKRKSEAQSTRYATSLSLLFLLIYRSTPTIKLSHEELSREMELATKAMEFANRAASNNTVINIFLVGAFGGLAVRSLNQQRQIESLESQRDSLVKSNKSMRQTIWDWKQKLYTEAEADKKPIVPLSKLKSIYGEVPTLPQSAGIGEKKDGKASATKIVEVRLLVEPRALHIHAYSSSIFICVNRWRCINIMCITGSNNVFRRIISIYGSSFCFEDCALCEPWFYKKLESYY
ncbi:unnamed protein product [Lactuca virosa]|uniref:Uncharacterized protein n=1 Tax=Lactuca virosa TaxID=75947 RepID=A0AAU9LQF6_9ASTR|nr:unnamed protein product [Lactuca virosa]